MAIGNAIQRGDWIHIHDENGHQTATIHAPVAAPGDGLKSYTSSSVNVQRGSWVYSYDERGAQTGVVNA